MTPEGIESLPTVHDNASNLLIAIAQPHLDATEALQRLASSIENWDELIQLAREHGMAPLLFHRLNRSGVSIPPAAHAHLQLEFNRNTIQTLSNAAELIRTLSLFEQHGITAMPFKGVVLGASVYGDPSLRPAGDLDILIQYCDLLRATALLRSCGFDLKTMALDDGTPEAPDYFEYHFERGSDGLIIELRWRLELTQPRFRRDLGLDWVWPSRRFAMLAGAKIPDMGPETTLLVLCMHGSKHIWSRMIWILDVAQVIASCPDLDWDRTLREARRQGLGRPLALGVLLAHRLTDAAVPAFVLSRFERDRIVMNLVRHIQLNLFSAPGTTPSGRIPYNVQLLDKYDRMRLILSLNFLRPNERDRAFLPLPGWLAPLYLVVRPFRILRDRSAR